MKNGQVITMANRIVDTKLIDSLRREPCTLCKRIDNSSPHHIKTVGANGPDIKENLMPLCLPCHILIHKKALSDICKTYPQIRLWLEKNGWEWDYTACKYLPKF